MNNPVCETVREIPMQCAMGDVHREIEALGLEVERLTDRLSRYLSPHNTCADLCSDSAKPMVSRSAAVDEVNTVRNNIYAVTANIQSLLSDLEI